MHFYYITFRSVTFAQRAERILAGEGYAVSLQRTPRWMEAQGCGYALRIWTKEVSAAVQILQREKIPMRKLYVQKKDGQLEERPL